MLRRSLAPAFVMAAMVAVAMPHARADAVPPPSLVGAWTLNKDLSDKPPDRAGGEGREGGQRGAGGRGGGGGHRRGGGFGGGGFGGGGAGQAKTPEDMVRMRNALRDELQAPEHLTITQTDTTVIMTAGDGRTMQLGRVAGCHTVRHIIVCSEEDVACLGHEERHRVEGAFHP